MRTEFISVSAIRKLSSSDFKHDLVFIIMSQNKPIAVIVPYNKVEKKS